MKIKSEAGWSQLCNPGINFEHYYYYYYIIIIIIIIFFFFFLHFTMLGTTKIIVNGNYSVDQP